MSETIELGSIARLDMKPGETLVVRFDRRLSQSEAADAKHHIQPHLPDGVKLLVVGEGVDLQVVTAASEWQPVPDKWRP